MKVRVIIRVAIAVVACLATGCGRHGPATFPLSGTVTWNGKPVPAGLIRLVPDADAGNQGPATVAEITQGHYATAPGKGIIGGAYRVWISGNDGVPYDNASEGIREVQGRLLFADQLQKVEFPRGEARHDFVLTGK